MNNFGTKIEQVIDPPKKDEKLDLLVTAILSFTMGMSIHELSSLVLKTYTSNNVTVKLIYTLIIGLITFIFFKKYTK